MSVIARHADQNFPMPSALRKGLADRTHLPFLTGVEIGFGPAELLVRLFEAADAALRAKGIHLTFAGFDELLAINQAHSDSWRPLLPVFDHRFNHIAGEDGFVVIGRDSEGQPATAHAFRRLRLSGRSLKSEIESLRVFYADPAKDALPDESIQVTAPSATSMSEKTVFSGAVWFRPDFRRSNLLEHIQPVVRALSYTRWSPRQVVSFMAPEVVRGGIATSGRFPHVEWHVTMNRTRVKPHGTIAAALVFANESDQLEHFVEYMDAADADASSSKIA